LHILVNNYLFLTILIWRPVFFIFIQCTRILLGVPKNVLECKRAEFENPDLDRLLLLNKRLSTTQITQHTNRMVQWLRRVCRGTITKALMAHCEDFKMCLQQHVAVNCRQSSNLMACGRLFSNDEPNTEPFRDSNRTAATYLHNDDINYVWKKKSTRVCDTEGCSHSWR